MPALPSELLRWHVGRDNITPACLAAYEALQRYVVEGGNVTAVAAAIEAERNLALLREEGITPSRGQTSVWRLPGLRNRPKNGATAYLRPPGTDHPVLLISGGRPAEYQSEPYHLTVEDLREMIDFAAKHGLHFYIDNLRGLHYPGMCLVVHWRSTVTLPKDES